MVASIPNTNKFQTDLFDLLMRTFRYYHSGSKELGVMAMNK